VLRSLSKLPVVPIVLPSVDDIVLFDDDNYFIISIAVAAYLIPPQ
jgi:hypothetical protein